jgi:hypothetical protein
VRVKISPSAMMLRTMYSHGLEIARLHEIRHDDEVVGRVRAAPWQAQHQRSAVAEDFFVRIEQHADDIGAAGLQRWAARSGR